MSDLELSQKDFEDLRRFIHELCGLYIRDEKRYLILQRLEDLVRESGCGDFNGFCRLLAEAPSQEIHERVIAAITTNETSFFRDTHPFEAFRTHILPKLAARRKTMPRAKAEHVGPRPKIRIWCAGASTGQEPYSLAMLIREYAAANLFYGIQAEDFSILATDVSSAVLHKAQAGLYNEMDLQRGLPPTYREKYFRPEGNGRYAVKDEVRRLVEFRKMNLIEPLPFLGSFQAIFCRNVLIYFDDETKRRILDRLHAKLDEGGVLVLGSAENLYCLTEKFDSLHIGETIVYLRKNGASTPA